MPREGFEPPVLGLKVQSIDHCANGAWPVFALAVYSPSFLRSFRRPLSCRPACLLVGHLGVEPSATALSERPLRPAGSWPADGGGPGPSASAPFRVQAGGCHPAASPSRCGRRRTRPPAVARSPDFESGTASMAVSSSTDLPRCERAGGCGGWRSRLPAPCGAHPLSKRSRPPGRFILQARKAGDLNARVSPPHPLATEPGAPVRFTFHSYRTADSNREPPGSGPGAST